MSLLSEKDSRHFWNAFGRVLKADLRDGSVLRGLSGIDHDVEAIFVDDKGKRVIIASAEPNPRTAALLQVDVQAAFSDGRVLVMRPIAVDIASIAKKIVQQFGMVDLPVNELANKLKAKEDDQEILKAIWQELKPFGSTFDNIRLPIVNQIVAGIHQLTFLDWQKVLGSAQIPLMNLLTLDSMDVDRRHGVCPIPLYEFTEKDWEIFLSGNRPDDVEEHLKKFGIFQYFFPPPDQIALGLADRNSASVTTIASAINLSPQIGHPLGAIELVDVQSEPHEAIIEKLIDRGYLCEGEFGCEITEKGRSQRSLVKFRPREGFISKLIQRFNVMLNLNI